MFRKYQINSAVTRLYWGIRMGMGVGGRKEMSSVDPQVLPLNPGSRQGSRIRGWKPQFEQHWSPLSELPSRPRDVSFPE